MANYDPFGILDTGASPSPTTAPAAQPVAQPLIMPTPVAASKPIDPFVVPKAEKAKPVVNNIGDHNELLFKRLCVLYEGVLYEDDVLHISLKSEYSGNSGRMVLTLCNITQEPLTAVNTMFPAFPSCVVQAPNHIVGAIKGRDKAQLLLLLRCNAPFTGSHPMLNLSFLVGGRHRRDLKIKLPVTAVKFIEPLINMTQAQFVNMWRQIKGAPNEATDHFNAKPEVGLEAIAKVMTFGLRFSILNHVDPNKHNFVGAGTFYSGNGQVVCMVRVETNPTTRQCRTTIKTYNNVVTHAIRKLLLVQLKA